MSLIVFPIFLGMVLLGRKLVTLYLTNLSLIEQPLSRPVVFDATAPNATPMGQVVGYDRFGAPEILYRDATAGAATPGVLMSVRPQRFTTVSRAYYAGAGCTGNVFVKAADATIGPWPNVGFFFQTDGWNYAVGRDNFLYRESVQGTSGAGQAIGSVWVSEDTRDASPAGFPSTACVDIPGAFDATLAKFTGSSIVHVSGAPTLELESGFVVNINGAADGVQFPNGNFTITVTGPTTFTYDSTVVYGAALTPLTDTAKVTPSATVPNLVSAFCVSALGNVAGAGQCATTNFLPPYRVGFSNGIQ